MNKSTFFSGQPIFTQLLRFIPRQAVQRIACEHKADRYCKTFNTYEHLITILYSIYNNCNSLREVVTGMLASEQRLQHLGVRFHPRRSTLSDANVRRSEEVFRDLYAMLYQKYQQFLSDSRPCARASRLYIMDSTVIQLFHDVLRTTGLEPAKGKRKGGIKVHALIRSDQDVPNLIRLSKASAHDAQYLKEVELPKGSILVFDRGYRDFTTFKRFTAQKITWITRLSTLFAYQVKEDLVPAQNSEGILSDQRITMGWRPSIALQARLIKYRDPHSGEVYEFLTNNFKMRAATICDLYRKRWQIEVLFKRLKQNYQLQYFLGDSENAIKLQVWCVLIADLLLKVVKKAVAARWSFSNLAAMIRLHLMTYIDLFAFLKAPEKALVTLFCPKLKPGANQLRLIT